MRLHASCVVIIYLGVIPQSMYRTKLTSLSKAINKVEDMQMDFEIKGEKDSSLAPHLTDITQKLEAMKSTEKQAKKLVKEIEFMFTDIKRNSKALLAGLKDLKYFMLNSSGT